MARWTGLCWPILKLCWGYVVPSVVYVGAKFAHLELCRVYGRVTFMMSPSFPKLKICVWSTSPQWPVSVTFRAFSLPPVACKSVWGELRPSKGPCWLHVAVIFFQKSVPPQHNDGFWSHLGPMLDASRGSFEPSCWRIDSRNALPSGQQGRITIPAKHFFSKTSLLPGTGIANTPLNGSMLAYLGAMLGLCWPIWGLCWGHVHPSWSYLGTLLTLRRWFWAKLFSCLHLHSQILLEKAPASGLRGSCLDSWSKIPLFLSSPQWPASFTFWAFLLPPVACESQVPPKGGVGGINASPPLRS